MNNGTPTFQLWVDVLGTEIHNALTPYKAKRLPPYITEEARNKAVKRTTHIFIQRNIGLVKTFERKQNEVTQRIEVLNADLQVAKQNFFAWFIDGGKFKRGGAVRRLKNELIEAAGILDGLKLGLTIIATNKPE